MRVMALMIFFVLTLPTLVSCASVSDNTPSPTTRIIEQSSIPVLTTSRIWRSYEKVEILFSNTSQTDLRLVPAEGRVGTYRTPLRFYQRTSLGWRPVVPNRTAVYATTYQTLTLEPGSTIVFGITGGIRDISSDFSIPGAYLARVEYENPENPDSSEIWQYSDEFLVTLSEESEQESRVAPELEVSCSTDQFDMPNFRIINEGAQPIWLQPVCSTGHGVEETRYADDAQTNLQILTEIGWVAIHPSEHACRKGFDPQRIDPGQLLYVDAAEWYFTEAGLLEPGIYRWDIVIYLYADSQPGDDIWLADPRHIYGDLFEYVVR